MKMNRNHILCKYDAKFYEMQAAQILSPLPNHKICVFCWVLILFPYLFNSNHAFNQKAFSLCNVM